MFLRVHTGDFPFVSLCDHMHTHKVGYDGTEVCVAEQLSFDRVAALPPAGAGGTVRILDLVDSGLAHLLGDPS
eukprot:2340951-Amphidinium_carterae.1